MEENCNFSYYLVPELSICSMCKAKSAWLPSMIKAKSLWLPSMCQAKSALIPSKCGANLHALLRIWKGAMQTLLRTWIGAMQTLLPTLSGEIVSGTKNSLIAISEEKKVKDLLQKTYIQGVFMTYVTTFEN